ncbi:hypothetical protein ACOME3_009156 [Neoechinorhynchus agilis]
MCSYRQSQQHMLLAHGCYQASQVPAHPLASAPVCFNYQQQKADDFKQLFQAQKRRLEEEQPEIGWNQQPLRCEATVRERNRMYHLNQAFDELRNAIPKSSAFENRRLSKIATLRLAIQYIGTLTRILQHYGGVCPIDPNSTSKTAPKRKRTCTESDNVQFASQNCPIDSTRQCIEEAFMWTVDSNVLIGMPNQYRVFNGRFTQ